MKKLSVQHYLSIAISVVIIISLFWLVDIHELSRRLQHISMQLFLFNILLLIPGLFLTSYRWKLLFDKQGHSIRLSDSVRICFAGAALNLILPASTGDLAKSYFGYKWSGVKERMLAISLVDKIIALATAAVIGIPMAVYAGLPVFAGIAACTLIPLIVLALVKRLYPAGRPPAWLERVSRAVSKRINSRILLNGLEISGSKALSAVLISLAVWTLAYIQLYLSFRMIGAAVSIYYVLAAGPLLTLVRLWPFTINGVGTDEAAIIFLFSGIASRAISHETALAAALLYRVVMLIVPGLIGLVFLNMHKRMEMQ